MPYIIAIAAMIVLSIALVYLINARHAKSRNKNTAKIAALSDRQLIDQWVDLQYHVAMVGGAAIGVSRRLAAEMERRYPGAERRVFRETLIAPIPGGTRRPSLIALRAVDRSPCEFAIQVQASAARAEHDRAREEEFALS